jgi:cytochrome c peroxidase
MRWAKMLVAASLAGVLTLGCDRGPTDPVAPPDAMQPTGIQAVLGNSPMATLGKKIFFDATLSINQNQSCASCHDPAWGWTGPDAAINATGAVYEGSIPGRFGDRKPPTSAYATQSPIFSLSKKGLFEGGNFWDGRATGEELGNPAADQARGPFLNTAEQALPDLACVIYRIQRGSYVGDYVGVWGDEITNIVFPASTAADCASEGTTVALSASDRDQAYIEYDRVARSIAAFEASPEVNSFSSKFDTGRLSKEEQRGYALFRGKGGCARCHPANGPNPLFTDFSFDNLGVPKNPANPATMTGFIDRGLGAFLLTRSEWVGAAADEMGKVKVPTLRNVDERASGGVKAYAHNGYFKTLWQIVHFYNTRDTKPTCPGDYTVDQAIAAYCWPAPEVADNVNDSELGDLGLSYDEELAIVAFMTALTDQ